MLFDVCSMVQCCYYKIVVRSMRPDGIYRLRTHSLANREYFLQIVTRTEDNTKQILAQISKIAFVLRSIDRRWTKKNGGTVRTQRSVIPASPRLSLEQFCHTCSSRGLERSPTNRASKAPGGTSQLCRHMQPQHRATALRHTTQLSILLPLGTMWFNVQQPATPACG
ncbi:hypothetical protein VTO73DRAFT_15048 [Trametes versicolor]